MNSKKNSFKRVAAGALAVLTVAAYTAPVANVGGLPNNLLTADAALDSDNVKSTVLEMVEFGDKAHGDYAYDYITSATAGNRTANATTIKNAQQYEFYQGKVLTITSKVPLRFSNDNGANYFTNLDDTTHNALPFTTDLTVTAVDTNSTVTGTINKTYYVYGDKYLVSESNGTYTYKVLVSKNLQISGIPTSVNIINVTDDKTLQLTDNNYVDLKKVEDANIIVNDEGIVMNAASQVLVNDPIIKSNAKVVADKMFEVYVKDNTNPQAAIVTASAKFDSEIGMFVAEAPIPVASTGIVTPAPATNVSIYLNKVDPNYTYTNKGTYLLATATNAPQVTAASITATYEAMVKKNKDELQTSPNPAYKYDTVTELKSGASVPNESRVVLTFNNDTTGEVTTYKGDKNLDLTTFYTLKITKDGKELAAKDLPFVDSSADKAYPAGKLDTLEYEDVYSTLNAHVPSSVATTESTSKLAFSATGVYKVEYTVYTKTKSNGVITYTPETLTFNFTIAPKTALTAKNVRLIASYENATANTANYKPILNGSTLDGKTEKIKKVGIVNGVVQFEVSEDWTTNDIITVAPTIFADSDDAADVNKDSTFAAGAADNVNTVGVDESTNGTPKSVIGTTKSNTLNQVNEMTVVYNNAEFSSSDQVINVKWKLVEAKKAIKFTKNDDYTTGGADINSASAADYYFQTTVDQLKTFREDLFDTMTVENADIDDISFEYVSGYGITPTTDVLNYHEDGLPTEAGKYSVFFVYEGEVVASVNVKVSEHALFASLSAKQTSYTYGTKKLENDDITFVDVNDKTIKDAGVKDASIKYYKALKLSTAQCKKITADGTITLGDAVTVDGVQLDVKNSKVFTIGSEKCIKGAEVKGNNLETVPGYINAGNYIVEVASEENKTSVAKKGYELQLSVFAVSVAKKAITADMVVFDAVDYKDGATVLPAKYKVVDTAVKLANGDGYKLPADETSIAGGTTSAQNIGEYPIGVQVIGNTSNYTGKVSAKWHVVKPGTEMKSIVFSDAKTTIYDNGQIHFEITRPDNTQFANGVVKYGVVIDKDGKIPAPTKVDVYGVMKYPRKISADATTTTEFEDAAKALQIGNGFKEGNQGADQKAATPLKYGANIAVKNVETGAWFRPYVIDGKGNIFYGEVIYVNLVQEATDVLKLTMANSGAHKLVANDATSGLNTTIQTKDKAKENQSAANLASKKWREDVQSGYDKISNRYYVYGSYTLEGNDLVKQSAVQGFGVVVDKKGAFTPAGAGANDGILVSDGKTTVADGLKLGKGFIEGKGGSNKMDVDEYGAMIVPANSVTGVWVRAYVDLGNDLVVYTDPVYITDVSTYFNADGNLGALADAPNNEKHYLSFTANDTPVNNLAGATLKSSGVIVDTSGKYAAKNPATGDYLTGANAKFADAAATTKANAEMLLGKGFLQGKKTGTGLYKATVAPKYFSESTHNAQTPIPIVVRRYAVYTIGDVEVTIYSAPEVKDIV